MRKRWTTVAGRLLSVVTALAALASVSSTAQDDSLATGLYVTFQSKAAPERIDHRPAPNVWLYVDEGDSPSPFVSPGPFAAEWTGFVSADLRSYYTFHAEFNGRLRLEINGATLLDATSTGSELIESQRVRLNKGTNSLVARFESPVPGAAFVRLEWAERGALPVRIPRASLSCEPSAELRRWESIRRGRELFALNRCVGCHAAPGLEEGMPELAMDAPSLEAIGSRRNADWMADWILSPREMRATARMPVMFHGDGAREKAEAVAAYLGSLNKPSLPEALALGDPKAGEALFQKLHCGACHQEPGGEETSSADNLSLAHVNEKFSRGALAVFLQSPNANYKWIGMPDFKLSDEEAANLAAYLGTAGREFNGAVSAPEARLIATGRELVQNSGCAACHEAGVVNMAKAPSLDAVGTTDWTGGCLADDTGGGGSETPVFNLSAREREDLRVFANSALASLRQASLVEFAERQTKNLRCGSCHGEFEGFPRLEILGGKLKPEWSAAFIDGQIPYKPRPWIEARMPAFHAYAAGLAKGMSMDHGYAPRTEDAPPVDLEMAEAGRTLVSAPGGFSCVACHGVREMEPTQVFESAGVNLAYTGERLRKSFFERWLLNPLTIDPATKMPVYFDEDGRSPLPDVYGGDGKKQIDALWQYIRLGDKMPLPPE